MHWGLCTDGNSFVPWAVNWEFGWGVAPFMWQNVSCQMLGRGMSPQTSCPERVTVSGAELTGRLILTILVSSPLSPNNQLYIFSIFLWLLGGMYYLRFALKNISCLCFAILSFTPVFVGGWGEKKESEVAQSCLTLLDSMDCSLPGSSVHEIFQARILEWVAISFSRGSSQPRDWTQVYPNYRQTLYYLSHQEDLVERTKDIKKLWDRLKK